MTMESNVFTGKLAIDNIEVAFVFENSILKLLPSHSDENDARTIFFKSNKNLFEILMNPPRIKEPYLRGTIYEKSREIIFIPQVGSQIVIENSVISIVIVAYIVFEGKINKFDRIDFNSPEINAIYPADQAIDFSELNSNEGVYKISRRPQKETFTENKTFIINGKKVYIFWGVSINSSAEELPIHIDSHLVFKFEATEDFTFSYTIWNVARKFINYLCYRRNTWLPTAVLSGTSESGLRSYATLNVLGQEDETVEEEAIRQRRFISQSYIEGHEGDILQDITKETLYLRHLPETYRSGNYIDASRFVMITAAFEREFKRLYPEGIVKDEIDINVEKRAKESIEKLIQEIEGGQKTKEDKLPEEKYKNILKSIPDGPLAKKICYAGKQIDDVVGIFAKHLYSSNGGKPKYKSIGQRLARQRNNFAHGNIEEKFIGPSLFDLVFLEWIVYAM